MTRKKLKVFMHYCPKCFNQSLNLETKGIVEITINGKKKDNGRFLFSLESESNKEEALSELHKKIDEFFSWYGNFSNPETIDSFDLTTSNVFCENNCKYDLGFSFSIVNILFSKNKVIEYIRKTAKKYNIEVNLELD